MSELGIIAAEDDDICELCGLVDETRPYGPNGELVCFDCMMQDEEAAKRQFAKKVHGDVPC